MEGDSVQHGEGRGGVFSSVLVRHFARLKLLVQTDFSGMVFLPYGGSS